MTPKPQWKLIFFRKQITISNFRILYDTALVSHLAEKQCIHYIITECKELQDS